MSRLRPPLALAVAAGLGLAVLPLGGVGAQLGMPAPVPPDDEPLPPALSTPPDGWVPATPEAPAATITIEAPPGAGTAPAHNPDSFLPSLTGPIGLYQISTAEVGPPGHVRFALHGQYFRINDFLVEGIDEQGDTHTRLAGTFGFGFTLHEAIEIFGAVLAATNRNQRTSEPGRRDPELIKAFGDIIVGGKGVLPFGRGFSAGAELGLRFLSSVSGISFSPSSTSLWIGPVASYDLRRVTRVPVRFHVNANFYLDNSSNLFDFAGTGPFTHEVAMFAYGIAGSRIRVGLGVDAPLERLTGAVPLQPFFEYHAEVVTASADPAFAAYTHPNNRDQHWLTFGLRARVYAGLTVDAGVNMGLRSVGYQYGPPVPPYDVIFGLGFPLDVAGLKRPVIVTQTVEKPVTTPPTTGTVAGKVTGKPGAGSGLAAAEAKPVADAIISFQGRARGRVASDPDGGFQSGPLAPGLVEAVISAPGYEPAKATSTIVAGGAATMDVVLVGKVATGNVRGKVSDKVGKGVSATLRFAGAGAFETRADESGAFSAALPAGPYKVTAEAPGFASKDVPLDIAVGQDRPLEITMRAPNPDVTMTTHAVVLKVPIKFKPGVPQLDDAAKGQLAGVADLMQDHPEIRTLRVEAHWNGAPGNKAVTKLTERQAAAVKEFLVARGTPADRIEAVGMGGTSPLVPNLGPANQMKNRRIELVVAQ